MLKRASNKIQELKVDEETSLFAVMPDKSVWDSYTDGLFDRDKEGNLKTNSGRAIRDIYKLCVKKVTNVEVDGIVVPEITDPNKIVEFLSHIGDVKAGQKIDGWLLGLGELTKAESKNLSGEQSVSSSLEKLPETSTVTVA